MCLKTSLAKIDADARELIRLRAALDKLQVQIVERKQELFVVFNRADSHRDTVKRNRMEHQNYEDTIKKMEGEFSSSGNNCRELYRHLVFFDFVWYRYSLIAAESGPFLFEKRCDSHNLHLVTFGLGEHTFP